ncbi:DDB1- and CUL4-associated factor 6-like isoform X2 [Artemia franciscana]|uniref:Uncharacterized protein n=1 Tax=Artemia franciscana TaxID=6661 RepID=A0AA88LBG0_ARTSF|nr:hypothetical protein QYM36_010043 [Artemia franciscana]
MYANNLFSAVVERESCFYNRPRPHRIAKDSQDIIQRLTLERRLKNHRGCVNSLVWNSNGNLLLSGSDDRRIIITQYPDYKVLIDYKTVHNSNIFSAKFLAFCNDRKIVSCSSKGSIVYTDIDRIEETSHCVFECHSNGVVYAVSPVPDDPNLFLSCCYDGTVRCFDLRLKTSCSKENCDEDTIIKIPNAVTCMATNPKRPHQLAIGCSDSCARIFDRRALKRGNAGAFNPDTSSHLISCLVAPEARSQRRRITSVEFSPDGEEILVSYCSEYTYLFPVEEYRLSEPDLPQDGPESFDSYQFLNITSSGPPNVRRLRLRGDWSDTGPHSRPESEVQIGQARPTLQSALLRRMNSFLLRLSSREIGDQDTLNESANQGTAHNEIRSVGPSSLRSTSRPIDIVPRSFSPPVSSDSEIPVSPPSTIHSDAPVNIDSVTYDSLANQSEDLPGTDQEIFGSSLPNNRSSVSLSAYLSSNADLNGDRNDEASKIAENEFLDCSYNGKQSAKYYARKVSCPKPTVKYIGHRNARTAIKESNFWGSDFVVSGSDCGRIFFWNRRTGNLIKVFEADRHVTNCVQPHPYDPILASSGIDHDIKIWSPLSEEPTFDEEAAYKIIETNALMLEETRDTLTVPAHFMIRMLSTLRGIRTGSSPAASNNEEG